MDKQIYEAKTEKEAVALFSKIADVLFNRYILVANEDKLYRLQEIEFYLNTPSHPDGTCHRATRQSLYGEWYVHRSGNDYAKINQRTGIDLCLGNDKTVFAILIRSVTNIKTNEVISGPVKVLKEFYGDAEYMEHSKNIENHESFEENPYLYLKQVDGLKNGKIKFSKRIGLNEKLHPDFANRKYRASMEKEKI